MADATPKPLEINQIYAQEREKRLRPDGISQFIEIKHDKDFRDIARDPWVDHKALNALDPVLSDGDHVKFLILGAGYGGLLVAVRLIQQGFSASDIRFIDNAGGFGGTWYWNRYPGLRCDVESYIYMPLLEETGYMPLNKYSHGEELMAYADRIAKQWNLAEKALFRVSMASQEWDEAEGIWKVNVSESRGPGEEERKLTIIADTVVVASGLFPEPQVPKVDGMSEFKGGMFHTARWNYDTTGGAPGDPSLHKLKDKTVGIIGTGATAIQVVPQLAQWCKHLYVFQRTPSAVDTRGQKPTDPKEWATSIATGPGWQRRRMENFNAFVTQSNAADENMVDDKWTVLPSYRAVLGTEGSGIITPEMIPEHVGNLIMEDLPHMERLRHRVEEVVKDKATAEKLKAWYNSWCKRPTFSDEYLQTFNRDNVTLVDTDGKGVDSILPHAVVVNAKEYPIDVLVLSTGYRTPGVGNGSPAVRTGITIKGRGGQDFDEKWQAGVATLHGVASNGFPNMFFLSPSQIGSAANNVYVLDILSEHIAYIVAEAERAATGPKQANGTNGTANGYYGVNWRDTYKGTIVEVSKEAEEAWSMQCMMRAGWYAAVAGCTPGYINNEGKRLDNLSQEDQMKLARAAGWPEGPNHFRRLIQNWREQGKLEGYVMGKA